jgi:hypothetical protein
MASGNTTVSIAILVPAGQEDSAAWLCNQEPQVAADALRLCGPAYLALQREVGREEHERLCARYQGQIEELQAGAERAEAERLAEVQRLAQLHGDKHRQLEAQLAQERETFLSEKRAAVEASRRASDQDWQQHLELVESRHAEAKAKLQAALASAAQEAAETERACRARYDEVALRCEADVAELQQRLHAANESWRDREQRLCQEREADFTALEQRLRREADTAVQETAGQWQSRVLLLEEARDREKRLLQAELQSANDRLAARQATEVQACEAVRVQYEDRLQTARALQDSLEQRHRAELEAKERQLAEAQQWHREQSERMQQEKEASAARYADDLRRLLEQQQAALSRFTGTSSHVGQAGEALVADVFSQLDLGDLEDLTNVRGAGHEDFLWRWTPPPGVHGEELRCSVEVKNVASLHSKKDIGKHHERLHEALAKGSINAAMFLSLRAKIPNCVSRVSLRTDSGVPVLYVYRTSEDSSVTAEGLVELGFRFLAQMWPEWCRRASCGEDVDAAAASARVQALQAAAALLDRQVEGLEALGRQLTSMAKLCDGLRKEVHKLQKTRDDMWRDISRTYAAQPELAVARTGHGSEDGFGAADETPPTVDASSAPPALEEREDVLPLLYLLRTYTDQKKRYPKMWKPLALTSDQMATVEALKREGVTLEDLREPVARLKRAKVAPEEHVG